MAKRLWYLVLVAAVLQVAVPALRERIAYWMTITLPVHLMDEDSDTGRVWPAPREPRDAWALLAAAELACGQSPEQDWQVFGQALAQAPGNECLAVRRAVRLTYWTGKDHAKSSLPLRRQAAVEVTRLAPDNAVGWYLLAAAEAEAGERDAALAHLARGNRAPRLDDGTQTVVWALRRHWRCRGLTRYDSLLRTVQQPFPHLARVRDLARTICRPRGTPVERCEVLAMGARWRDESSQLIPVLAGLAIEAIGCRDPAEYGPRNSQAPEAERLARFERETQSLIAQLEAAGHQQHAEWLRADLVRHRAGQLRAWRREVVHQIDDAMPVYGAVSALASAVPALLWAAFLALSVAGSHRRRPADAPRDAWIPVVVGPALLVLACVLLGVAFARLPVSGRSADGLRRVISNVMLLGAPLPTLWVLAWTRLRRCRPAAPLILVPMAAVLLLTAWVTQAPFIHALKTVSRPLEAAAHGDALQVRQAMDAAAPARLLPPEARP